ncbi:MAG: hypothetical protein HY328_01175 [Chloroflexi bacterium]|nr:hypothetical protein [Chloroflexota bacterium]
MVDFRRTPNLLSLVCAGSLAILSALLVGFGLATPLPAATASPQQSYNTAPLTPTLYLPLVQRPAPRLLIAAAHIDSAVSGEGDEALWLWNNGPEQVSLTGWQITGNGRTATFPVTSTLTIPSAAGLWCTANPTIFRRTFGFAPECEWGADDDLTVPDLTGSPPRLTNSGGVIQLVSPDGAVADVLVYGNESQIPAGWTGVAAQLYNRGAIGAEGQVWRRKPGAYGSFADTDRAADWSGDVADLAWGRQVFFPGWALWRADWKPPGQPIQVSGTLTLAIGPDGLYEPMAAFLQSAQTSLNLSLYTLEHPLLAQEIAAAAHRGVAVRLLLEGGPTGGISNLQRWCVALIAAAGGQIFYLDRHPDAPNGFRPRYRFLHAKYGIADGVQAFVGTENPTNDSMPAPVGESGPPGRRGVYLFAAAPQVADALAALFAYDWQPELFWDLRPFDPARDGPPEGYTPPDPLPTTPRPAPFRQPVVYSGDFAFHLLAAPEEATRPDNSLVSLLERAGAGDEIRWVQLYEHKYWGDTSSNPVADPNPRLVALIGAARRGARLRVLLDSYFDEPSDDRSNRATVDYLRLVAQFEGLDIQAVTGNPAGAGIHAKAGSLRVGDERWLLVGSLNGGEVSHKINREVSLLVNAPLLYDRLVELFDSDWTNNADR